MAYASIVTIATRVTGDGVNCGWSPIGSPITNAASPASGPELAPLGAGDNTLSVPDGALGVVLSPPAGSVVVKKLKGNAGDAGVTLHPTAPVVLSLAAGTGRTIILNAGAPETISVQWI